MKSKNISIDELKLIENPSELLDNKIILYGAGEQGGIANKKLKAIGIPASYFCDSNVQKWGTRIDGTEVMSIPQLILTDKAEHLTIIITSSEPEYIEQILQVIEGLNLRTKSVYTVLGLNISLLQHINDLRISNEERAAFLVLHENYTKLIEVKSIRSFSQRQSNAMIDIILGRIYESDNILVYQPAKVGSSTISKSLSSIGIPNTQIHYLNKTNVGPMREKLVDYSSILKSRASVKTITLVRDPIARDFSAFFHHIRALTFMQPGDSFLTSCSEGIIKSKTISEFDWFDEEFRVFFDIDVFAYPFDKESGYSIIKQGNVEVLLMKLEKLNELEQVIGAFVGAPHFRLVNANVGENKLYKHLYKNVMDTIKLPREVFSRYYENNPRMDHFYSEEEKAAFWKKWEKNIAD